MLTFIDLGGDVSDRNAETANIPTDYRGIRFGAWLDIFLEYALCLARNGKVRDSYVVCEAASDSIIFCHSREDMFTIHVTWLGTYLLPEPGQLGADSDFKSPQSYRVTKKHVLVSLESS